MSFINLPQHVMFCIRLWYCTWSCTLLLCCTLSCTQGPLESRLQFCSWFCRELLEPHEFCSSFCTPAPTWKKLIFSTINSSSFACLKLCDTTIYSKKHVNNLRIREQSCSWQKRLTMIKLTERLV